MHNGTVAAMPECCAKWKMELNFLKQTGGWFILCPLPRPPSHTSSGKLTAMGTGLNGNTAHYYTAAFPASAFGIAVGKMMNSSVTTALCNGRCW